MLNENRKKIIFTLISMVKLLRRNLTFLEKNIGLKLEKIILIIKVAENHIFYTYLRLLTLIIYSIKSLNYIFSHG